MSHDVEIVDSQDKEEVDEVFHLNPINHFDEVGRFRPEGNVMGQDAHDVLEEALEEALEDELEE